MSQTMFGSGTPGLLSVYAQIRALADATIANGVALATYSQGSWSDYAISAPEQPGSGEYGVAIPGYLPAGIYKASFFVPVASPASGDVKFATEVFDWNGSAIVGCFSALNVGSINGVSAAAVKLAVSAGAMVTGAAAAGTLTTTQMTTNLSATVANIYAGRVLYFTSGVNAGLACLITAYAVSGGRLTFVAYGNSAAPSAPSAADTFIII